jgi:hypothetical protein
VAARNMVGIGPSAEFPIYQPGCTKYGFL